MPPGYIPGLHRGARLQVAVVHARRCPGRSTPTSHGVRRASITELQLAFIG